MWDIAKEGNSKERSVHCVNCGVGLGPLISIKEEREFFKKHNNHGLILTRTFYESDDIYTDSLDSLKEIGL